MPGAGNCPSPRHRVPSWPSNPSCTRHRQSRCLHKLSAVALNTTVASSTDRKAGYRFAQTADNLSVVQESVDAPTHFIPEGNLTPLP